MSTTHAFAGRTAGELAAENPVSIRVFEAWKIDYCCGERTPLDDGLHRVGKTIEEFAAAIEALETK